MFCAFRPDFFLEGVKASVRAQIIYRWSSLPGVSRDGAAKIEVQSVVKRFGKVIAVDGVSFAVKEGEILGLLGPSGCGKTTILRSISGLEEIDGGKILLDGAVVSSPAEKKFVPPEKRRLGFVFQNYALWPNMTVKQNIAYCLRGLSKEEKERRIANSLELVGLSDVGSRYPSQLSGGQQQRVALARSVSYEPKVILLDEPLSNLDQKERERVRGELRLLLKRIGITTVFVTHDQEEAFVICDRVILMNNGVDRAGGHPRLPVRLAREPLRRRVHREGEHTQGGAQERGQRRRHCHLRDPRPGRGADLPV